MSILRKNAAAGWAVTLDFRHCLLPLVRTASGDDDRPKEGEGGHDATGIVQRRVGCERLGGRTILGLPMLLQCQDPCLEEQCHCDGVQVKQREQFRTLVSACDDAALAHCQICC